MRSPQEVAMLLTSRTHRRLHTLLDLVDLAVMDAAILDEEQAVRAADESFDEIASALAKVADLLREAGEALAPAHQTLMQKAVNHDGDNHDA